MLCLEIVLESHLEHYSQTSVLKDLILHVLPSALSPQDHTSLKSIRSTQRLSRLPFLGFIFVERNPYGPFIMLEQLPSDVLVTIDNYS